MANVRRKILCIEDNLEAASLIAEELVDRGFEVEHGPWRSRRIDGRDEGHAGFNFVRR